MKLSAYIKALEALKAAHGDIEVEKDNTFGRVEAKAPQLAYRLILSRRQSKPAFWSRFMDAIALKGDPVIRL